MTSTLDGVDSAFMDDTHDNDFHDEPNSVDKLTSPPRRGRQTRQSRTPAAQIGLQLNPREAKMLVAELRTLVKSIDAGDDDLVAQTRVEFLDWVADQASKLHETH